MIEFDVRRTLDDQLIVCHDAAVAGASVAACTRADLAARAGLTAPLLTDVLELTAGRIGLDVELKEDGYVERVIALLRAGRHPEELIVTSFLDPVLAQLAALAPQVCTGLLVERGAEGAVRRARACGAGTLLPAAGLASGELLEASTAAGLASVIWDFDCQQHAALLADPRVRGVITDDVPAALAARRLPGAAT